MIPYLTATSPEIPSFRTKIEIRKLIDKKKQLQRIQDIVAKNN